jgi:ADP-heptose:LPS heptosyltransferase
MTEVPRLDRLIAITKRPAGCHWLDIWRPAVTQSWDLVFDLKGSALPYLLWAKKRLVFRPSHDTGGNRTSEWAHLLGLDELPPPRVWTGARHEQAADALLGEGRPIIALGPGASWAPKMWPAERFAELALRLTAADSILPGARFALIGTENEKAMVPELFEGLPPERTIDLFGRTDLLTAAAVIKRAAFYVGNDSGPLNLSVAAGIPGLGLVGPSRPLFGSPDPAYVAPWASRTALAYTTLTFEEMVSAPGYDHRTAVNLMDTLTVDAAEAAARALWQSCGKDGAAA